MNPHHSHLARTALFMLAAAALAATGAPGATRPATPDADAIVGRWLNGKGVAVIEVYKGDGLYMGKVVWLKEPAYPADDPKGMAGQERVDRENPDPALRGRPILGLVIMRGFVFDGGGSWSKGRVYDPENGKEYRGKMTLTSPDVLSLRGYVGITLFGRTERWTRTK
jgi:uncharacterized protein (DUF2147 family)